MTTARNAPKGDLGVETFSDVAPVKFRLPPSDVADLIYVFTTIESESGLKSCDPRAGELSRPRLVCERCGKYFEAVQAERWHVVGQRDQDGQSFGERVGSSRGDAVAFSAARFCGGACRRDTAREVERERQRMRSPEAPPIGSSTTTIRTGDGRTVRAYAGTEVRRMPPGPEPDEKECMAVGSASEGGSSKLDLLDLEAFVFHRTPRHARAWACLDALSLMGRQGNAMAVSVLRRLYSDLDPNARYGLWGKGAGLPNFDSREIASVAPMTKSVREWRQATGDGSHALIDRALRSFSGGPKRDGESRAAFQAREREAAHLRRLFLVQVGKEAEELIAAACSAYRTARRAV